MKLLILTLLEHEECGGKNVIIILVTSIFGTNTTQGSYLNKSNQNHHREDT